MSRPAPPPETSPSPHPVLGPKRVSPGLTPPSDFAQSPSGCAELISIGHIRKPHGVRGELCLTLETEDAGLVNGTVYLAPPGGDPVAHTVRRLRPAPGGHLLLTLAGVDSRDKAEALRRCRLLIHRTALPPPAEGEVYLFSLPGLRVLAREAEGQEEYIGRIASVSSHAGQEIWTILPPQGREILFPAVPDFVLGIDLDAGLVRISPPPGLIALYLGT